MPAPAENVCPVGTGDLIQSIKRLDRERWAVHLHDQEQPVVVSTAELLSPRRFAKRCFQQLLLLVPDTTKANWDQMLCRVPIS